MLICPLCERTYPFGGPDRCPHDDALLYALGDAEGARRALKAGDVVANKFELLEPMERRGGAGRTFKARQMQLERVVELRLLPENSITKPGDHARFRREVATWARLRNDHLVRLYDSGFTETNAPYMALEFIDGGSLGRLLREHGPLDLQTSRDIAVQALIALDAAHEAMVLHRDISPDALVLGTRGDGTTHARLTGFGLAKHMGTDDDDPTAITMTGQVIGNPAYMAPEQIMAGVLEPRTDLYALGVTIYEMVAGRRPFPGTSLSDLLAAHVKGRPDPITRHRPDVPPAFAAWIERLIAREPDARFPSAAAALAALPTLDAAPEVAATETAPRPEIPSPADRAGFPAAPPGDEWSVPAPLLSAPAPSGRGLALPITLAVLSVVIGALLALWLG